MSLATTRSRQVHMYEDFDDLQSDDIKCHGRQEYVQYSTYYEMRKEKKKKFVFDAIHDPTYRYE